MSKRTAEAIQKDLDKALTHYRENAKSLTTAQVVKSNEKVRTLQQELSDLYSHGAKECPKCKAKPMGMLKRPAFTDKNLGEINAQYEVGCPECPNRARGGAPAEAVKRWNAGEYVEK